MPAASRVRSAGLRPPLTRRSHPLRIQKRLDKYASGLDDRNFISLTISRLIPANDSINVALEYQKLAPMDSSEIIVTSVPMDEIMLEVVDTSELFTVEAMSLHPENEVLVTPSDHRHLMQWKIEHAILPGQGIVMMWHVEKNPRTQSSSIAL